MLLRHFVCKIHINLSKMYNKKIINPKKNAERKTGKIHSLRETTTTENLEM